MFSFKNIVTLLFSLILYPLTFFAQTAFKIPSDSIKVGETWRKAPGDRQRVWVEYYLRIDKDWWNFTEVEKKNPKKKRYQFAKQIFLKAEDIDLVSAHVDAAIKVGNDSLFQISFRCVNNIQLLFIYYYGKKNGINYDSTWMGMFDQAKVFIQGRKIADTVIQTLKKN